MIIWDYHQVFNIFNMDYTAMTENFEIKNGSVFLFQYVLDEKAKIVRDELYEYFILRTLYEQAKNSPLSKEEIQEIIKKDYHFDSFPQIHFDEAFKRVLKKKKIIGKENFSLSADVKTEINQNNQNYINLMTSVQDDLKKQILEKLPNLSSDEADQISQNFFKLLGRMFSTHGKEIANIIINQNSDIKNLESYEEFKSSYKDLILSITPIGSRNKLELIFNNFLFNSTENQSKFIFIMAQGHTLLEVLNVDPELQKYQENVLKKTQIYLDTNVIINILFNAGLQADSLRTIITESQKFGATFLMNDITKKEFEKWLENNKKEVSQIRSMPKEYSEVLFNKTVDAPLLMAYLTSLRKNPYQTIDQFCIGYEDISKNLKNDFEIEYDDKSIEDYLKNKKLRKLSRSVYEQNQTKPHPTVQHDSLCILKTKELRKEIPSGPLGPRVWFLTTDKTLWRAEKKIFPKNEIRASVIATVWMQIISPLISPDVKPVNITKAFSRLLSTNFSSDSVIKQEDILNISAAFLDDKGLSKEDFGSLLGDKHVRNTLNKLHLAQMAEDKEEEEKWTREGLTAVSQRLKNKTEKEIEKKLKGMTQQLTHQEKSIQKHSDKINEQDTDIQDLKEIVEKQWKKTFSILLFVAIGIGVAIPVILYFSSWNLSVDHLLTIIGIEVVIMIGIFVPWKLNHNKKS